MSFERKIKNKLYRIVPLATRVLVVASVNTSVKDWSAYIDAVPGENHENEWEEVARFGAKISQEMATLLFPELEKLYCWRK